MRYSNQIENESYLFAPRELFFSYFTPWILVCIIPIFDVLLGTEGFILLAIGLTTFTVTFRRFSQEIRRINKTYTWDEVKATVLRKAIVKLDFTTYCSKVGAPYRPKIKYSYTYNNNKYISDTFALGTFHSKGCNYLYSNPEEMKRDVDNLIRDNLITIYVNPENHEQSVIKRGLSETEEPSYVMLIINYIIVVLIFFALLG